MATLNLVLHWALAAGVLALDVFFVVATLVMDKLHHVEPPAANEIDTAATIGWLGVFGGCFIFGCYGILIKTPAVEEAKCDCMVFQCYSSVAVMVVSMVIWFFAGSEEGLLLNRSSLSMGVLFGVLWIYSQICGYNAVQAIGYAVAPAIWIGVTICVSFIWGVFVFHNPVHSWSGAIAAVVLMIVGVILAAASSHISEKAVGKAGDLLSGSGSEETETETGARGGGAGGSSEGSNSTDGEDVAGAAGSSSRSLGAAYACMIGVCNGSLMVPMSCFGNGCPAIGVQAYTGSAQVSLAFLPSLAIGIAVAHPVLFLLYWGRSMSAGKWPEFHFSSVALPAFLTGSFWGMGNFCAMFATVYLGQAVGFPLTQCCLIISGSWGIFYFQEIRGLSAIGLFAIASAIILAGATLDGISC